MLLCHIVGINNKLKNSFMTELKNINNNIIIVDLDDITKKIIFENEYNKIYGEFINNNNNKILLLSKLSHIWKNKFTNEINNILINNKNKYVILIGLITFYLDYRIKIILNEELKNIFFINTNIDDHIKQLIEFNLITYKNDIINGNFPLKYIDYNFLKRQREEIKDLYIIRDYKFKNYDVLINWIKHSINSLNGGYNKPVYFASFNRYENNINMLSNTIVGYSDKWLALLSLFSNNKLKRGITFKGGNKTPYVKELAPLSLKELNTCCYIYEMYPTKKADDYRFLIEDNKFIKRHYVSNIKNELEMDGTIIEKYT